VIQLAFSKNKPAADYATPFMLNLRTNPNNSDKGLALVQEWGEAYLYSSRNKQISDET